MAGTPFHSHLRSLPRLQLASGNAPVLREIVAHVNQLASAIEGRTLRGVKGGRIRGDKTGFEIKVDRGAASMSLETHPFKVTVRRSAGDAAARIAAGTVNGQMVTLAGVRLDADPAPELPLFNNGTDYLYLELTFDLEFQDGYLISAGLARVRIVSGASPLPYYAGGGTWRLHLGTISNFRVTAQNLISSLWANCCDGGPGVADLRVEQS